VIDSDGWMHSGDMGLIRTYLIKHPGINAVAVVGFPDARLSEVAVAFVRLESGQTVTVSELTEYCRGKIANYKIPRHVLFVDEFPMTGLGKVQKVKLREEARRRLKEGALTLNVSSCCAPNSNRDQS
jgi:fatty-acyl-CoA synthase